MIRTAWYWHRVIVTSLGGFLATLALAWLWLVLGLPEDWTVLTGFAAGGSAALATAVWWPFWDYERWDATEHRWRRWG